MKTNKWFLCFAVFATSFVFSSCNNDEPELDEGEYVDTETPGFYEIRTECTPETLCFSYNGCQYSLSEPFFSLNDMYPEQLMEPWCIHATFGYTLKKFNPDSEHWIIDNFFNISRSYIFSNAQNENGEMFMDKYSELVEQLGNSAYPASYCIDGAAFDGCNKLESVELHSNIAITGVNKIAFQGCENLTDIYVYGWRLPCVESKKFALDYDKVTLHVPENLDDACFNGYPWKRFKHVEKDLPMWKEIFPKL